MPVIEFWYDFASTYSYLSAMRVEDEARASHVELHWRPFLLGPIFQAQGWDTSPFNIYEAKGRYMWRDLERLALARGLPFTRAQPFPQNGLTAARLALIGAEEGWIGPFTRAVFAAQFGNGADISDRTVLAGCLAALDLDANALLAHAGDPTIKDRLRAQTEEATERGIFGAPSFLVARDHQLFWGDDRLEQALAWARKPA